MAVEIALTPDSWWEIDVSDQVKAAREAGFTSLGIKAEQADDGARAMFDAAGLRCHEVLALIITDNEAATLRSAAHNAAAAEKMGAPWVTTIFHSPITDDIRRLVARCAATFAEAGVRMAVEFHPFGPVTSIRDGLDMVDAAGAGAGAALLVDTWHFFFGDSTWSDLEELPLDKIAFIQFDDAPPPESDDLVRETQDRRVMPGDGTLDLARFASTMLDRGFDGLVSVEVLSAELRALPVSEFAARAYAATRPYWS